MSKITKPDFKRIREEIGNNYAQKSLPTNRFHEEDNNSHLGNYFETRNEFEHDVDRIIYSKSFRRLQHKAQVYSNKKGDHYRTRLTHTLEVAQIAKGISRNLNLNVPLTEAIALGHDIGHTPFGHAGEQVLDEIMRGKDDLGGKLHYSIDFGGFKHNFNSINILEKVEEKNMGTGLNLTWQTLDGILKHTAIIKKDKQWNLKRFVRDYSNYKSFIDYDYYKTTPIFTFPLTLEGQIVKISDEIAQREHDLDDGLRDESLSLNLNQLSDKINEFIKEMDSKFNDETEGYFLFNSLKKQILSLKPINTELKWNKLISIIISYFIRDVTETSLINICSKTPYQILRYNTLSHDYENLYDNAGSYDKKFIILELISFSECGKFLNESIEEFIENKIVGSYNVNRFDGKSKYILRQLFKAYYENPKQMTKKQIENLKRNFDNIIEYYNLVMIIMLNTNNGIKIFNEDSNIIWVEKTNINFDEILKRLQSFFKLDGDFKKLLNETINEFGNTEFELLNYLNELTYEEIIYLENCEHYNKLLLLSMKFCLDLHYCYLSVICNYISQMTDDYAMKEYQELYLN